MKTLYLLPAYSHMPYHFPKKERLKRQKTISTLFRKGNRWKGRAIILYYLPQQEQQVVNHQALFSVPKSRLKKAVDRNKIKRRLREAYRQHKHLMTSSPRPPYTLGYVYTKRTLTPYHALAEEMKASFLFLNS